MQGEWPTPRVFSSFLLVITIISSMISFWRRAGSKRHKRSARRSSGTWKGLRKSRDAGASTALSRGAPRRGGRGQQQCSTRRQAREALGPMPRVARVRAPWGTRGRVQSARVTTPFRLLRHRVLFTHCFIYCGHCPQSLLLKMHAPYTNTLGQLALLIL